ncbi:MAG: M20/M25/M40 family metallo-hydrolase [Spirochaetales bacterium]|nr:M20/M25/M40 family metallo-hydrolase [Spirochaetales bacterium]
MVVIIFLCAVVLVCAVRTVVFGMKRRTFSADTLKAAALDPKDLERLRKLVRIKSVSHQNPEDRDLAEFRKIKGWITGEYPRLARTCELHFESPLCCYLIWKGSNPSLKPGLFCAHYDVVGTEGQRWTMDPFGGDLFDGYVWGRGTLDTKCTMAGMLCAAEALIGEGFVPERTLYFAFGGDEEQTGNEGAGTLSRIFEEKGLFFDYVLDEGSIVAKDMIPGMPAHIALIGIAEKGIAKFRLKTACTGGHAAHPPRVTAAGRLARALYRLERKKAPLGLTKEVRLFLEGLAPYGSLALRILFSNLWLFKPVILLFFSLKPKMAAVVRTTRSITVMRGSDKDNVLPQNAEAIINCRILPGDTVIRALETCRRVIKDRRVEVLADDPGSNFDPKRAGSLKYFKPLCAAVGAVFPYAPAVPHLVTATTDSKQYADISSEIYRFVPLVLDEEEVDRIHGSDERISLINYYRCIVFFKEALRSLS